MTIITNTKSTHKLVCSADGKVNLIRFETPKQQIELKEIISHDSIYFQGKILIVKTARIDEENKFALVLEQWENDKYLNGNFSSFDFVPYQVSFLKQNQDLTDESSILITLSGSDCKLHGKFQTVYSLDLDQKITTSSSNLINNLIQIQADAPIVSFDIEQQSISSTICYGCQNGSVALRVFSRANTSPIQSQQKMLDGPISKVMLCSISVDSKDLLLVSALGYAVLYENIADQPLQTPIVMSPNANHAITTACLCDTNFDGYKEVILGAYDFSVFCFQLQEGQAVQTWSYQLEHPVMALSCLDLNCDGIFELVIVTMYGVTVMQPNLELAFQKLAKIRKFLAENPQRA